jgi:A/G-specific adenine glycosylase
MLQQTRAAAAIPFYEEFLRRFPDVESLARAPESQVLAAWSGLGYYSRARNLRRAAIAIVELGSFPRAIDSIRALPGIGPYTAAAIASIAFDLPHAVLDGNVMRVIARLMADPADIGSGSTRSRFQDLAQGLLDPRQPAAFNQAMMELGATVCLPRNPLCLVCPVAKFCEARSLARQAEFPVKLRKAAPIEESLEMVVVWNDGRVLMRQRAASDSRMAGFWELPLAQDLPDLHETQKIGQFQHTIVNHHYLVTVLSGSASREESLVWVTPDGDKLLPITTMSRKALVLFAKCETVVQVSVKTSLPKRNGVT